MSQVVGNLLSNAVKFTPPEGTISVEAGRAGEEVILAVRDTGIGLAPEALRRIFDLFTQEQTTLDRQQGGLGVGLTLVRRLVEMHGGRVEARSPGPGRGSEFRVTVPAAPLGQVLEPVATGAGPEPRNRVRVLIVEDNTDAANSLGRLLELLGHEVEIAADGPTAVRLATAVAPDVALVDIGLPGMDGYEVAKQFRAACPDVILVALTGYAREQDRRKAVAAGFHYHLAKPADPDALDTLLLRLARRSVTASEESPTTERS
jgi:two-component system CheB/CheR fusion protein